ncbi:putative granule-bound starch synthase 1, chloroplastic/amyloplastic [Sesbania bispinosa]|nr:putative granule-bound starch synthase 1, chloroplastic/amyloplastic [Sesbania bispinosa]
MKQNKKGGRCGKGLEGSDGSGDLGTQDRLQCNNLIHCVVFSFNMIERLKST